MLTNPWWLFYLFFNFKLQLIWLNIQCTLFSRHQPESPDSINEFASIVSGTGAAATSSMNERADLVNEQTRGRPSRPMSLTNEARCMFTCGIGSLTFIVRQAKVGISHFPIVHAVVHVHARRPCSEYFRANFLDQPLLTLLVDIVNRRRTLQLKRERANEMDVAMGSGPLAWKTFN